MLSIDVTPIGIVRSPRADRTDERREFGPIGGVEQPQWASEVMQRYYDA